MKIATVGAQTNISQLSSKSFPDAVLLLDIARMTDKRESLFFKHRLDVLACENKDQFLAELATLKNKTRSLGLEAKRSLPLKSKVPEHRWIVNTDTTGHIYVLLVSSSAPESLIKRLHRRLQGKVAQISQKETNFADVFVQEKFTEMVDSFNDAIKKQHLSDVASCSEIDAAYSQPAKADADIEQPLEAASTPDVKVDNRISNYLPKFSARNMKIAVIVMIGLFLVMCLMHRFTAPKHIYQLKSKVHRRH